MDDDSNPFDKRHFTKPWISLDATVFLGAFEPNFDYTEQCKAMLIAAGTEYRPVLTKSVSGELFKKLVIQEDSLLREKLFKFICQFFDTLHNKPLRAAFTTDKNAHETHLPNLKENFSTIPYDDLVHLALTKAASDTLLKKDIISTPIKFATTDEKIANEYTAARISTDFGLPIYDVRKRLQKK